MSQFCRVYGSVADLSLSWSFITLRTLFAMLDSELQLKRVKDCLSWWLKLLEQEPMTPLGVVQTDKFHEVCGDRIPNIDNFILACEEAMKVTVPSHDQSPTSP